MQSIRFGGDGISALCLFSAVSLYKFINRTSPNPPSSALQLLRFFCFLSDFSRFAIVFLCLFLYCMAASSKSARGIANFGKRIVSLNWNRVRSHSDAISASALGVSRRRAAHSSAYEKNPEDQILVEADHVIEPISENYWGPHPQTGVFGPLTDHTAKAHGPLPTATKEGSVLELEAWFRHTGLEDFEKPHSL